MFMPENSNDQSRRSCLGKFTKGVETATKKQMENKRQLEKKNTIGINLKEFININNELLQIEKNIRPKKNITQLIENHFQLLHK